jgi:hypothetical protein
MSSPYSPVPAGTEGPSQLPSRRPLASKVFLALATIFILLRLGTEEPIPDHWQLLTTWGFYLAAALCALLGAISAWVEMRGPRSARATLALNCALLGFILAALIRLLYEEVVRLLSRIL